MSDNNNNDNNTRPSQDQEETSSADCEESFKLVPTTELVAAPKSGGSDDTSSFRSSRLDMDASLLGIEIPSDGPCKLEDAFKMMEPMDLNSESSASPNPANNVSTEDAPRVIEKELLPVRAPPILVPVSQTDILVADPPFRVPPLYPSAKAPKQKKRENVPTAVKSFIADAAVPSSHAATVPKWAISQAHAPSKPEDITKGRGALMLSLSKDEAHIILREVLMLSPRGKVERRQEIVRKRYALIPPG